MNQRANATVLGAVLLVALAAAGCGGMSADSRPEPATRPPAAPATVRPAPSSAALVGGEVGDTAFDFALEDLSGRTVRLSDFRGKVVLVDFWATWCPPCREEIPGFVDLHAKYRARGVEFVGISFDQSADPVRRFVRSFGIEYPIVFGTPDVAMAYGGVDAIPTTFVIDREGRIRAKHTGYSPPELFAKAIESAL